MMTKGEGAGGGLKFQKIDDIFYERPLTSLTVERGDLICKWLQSRSIYWVIILIICSELPTTIHLFLPFLKHYAFNF